MIKPVRPSIFKILVILNCLSISSHVLSQSYLSIVQANISLSDQKKLNQAEEYTKQASYAENEYNKAAELNSSQISKKTESKRFEADEFYQKAYKIRLKIYQSLTENLLKKKTKDTEFTSNGKRLQQLFKDKLKIAEKSRALAEKKGSGKEKISQLSEAEKFENQNIIYLQKINYSLISWPTKLDESWIFSEVITDPGNRLVEKEPIVEKNEQPVMAIPPPPTQKEFTPPKDTLKSIKEAQIVAVNQKDTIKKVKNEQNKTDLDYTSAPPVSTVQKINRDTIPKPVQKNDSTIKKVSPEKKPLKIKTEELVGNDSSLYGKVKVNEEQIDQFNKFLKTQYPNDYSHYVIDFQKLDYSNIDSIQNAWHNYLYAGQVKKEKSQELEQDQKSLALNDSMAKDSVMVDGRLMATKNQNTPLNKASKSKSKNKNQVVRPQTPIDEIKNKPVKPSDNILASDSLIETTDTTGFIFRVQIVACRVPLDKKTLKEIYNGTSRIDELKEDGWYKYAIGVYQSYKEARKMRDNSSIPGAFVIAYVDGHRIKITPAIAYKKSLSSDKQASVNQTGNYRVQIIASHVPLAEKILTSTYAGELPIEYIYEDGWYKYSIADGKSFQDAQNLLKKLSIPGAFIVQVKDIHKLQQLNK